MLKDQLCCLAGENSLQGLLVEQLGRQEVSLVPHL